MPSGHFALDRIAAIAMLTFVAPWLHAKQVSTKMTPAAPLVIEGLGKGTVTLSGPWQFHPGDDPAWASPTFDSSDWEQLSCGPALGQAGPRPSHRLCLVPVFHRAHARRPAYLRSFRFWCRKSMIRTKSIGTAHSSGVTASCHLTLSGTFRSRRRPLNLARCSTAFWPCAFGRPPCSPTIPGAQAVLKLPL
jgi:hypothetical protein